MKIYLDVLKDIMKKGVDRKGRNGTTRGLFTVPMRFDLRKGFPATTTKKLAFRTMAAELFWFLSASSDNNELNRLGCHIWDANAEADYWKPKAKFKGDLGRVYGVQWRTWKTPDGKIIDQLQGVIDRLKKDPHDRRLVVTAWNPGELDQMALPACHMIYQFHSANGELSLHMFQRSCDMFLGVPFNIASYALLLHLVAQMTNHKPRELILTLGDAHIYEDHFSAVKIQLKRKPKKLPTLWLNPKIKKLSDIDIKNITGPDDIYRFVKLENYNPEEAIKAKMAV